METVILSLHERWWKKIAAGEKRLEIRKTRPQRQDCQPCRVLVYVTGGVGVCGEFTCCTFHKIKTLPEVQHRVGIDRQSVEEGSCLTRRQLNAYAGGSGRPLWGWEVERVTVYEKPVPLSLYGLERPPQSWQYFTGKEPFRHCVVCGRRVEKVEPCPYNKRTGSPTCPVCCEKCYETEPFPCWEHDCRRKGGGKGGGT